MPAPPYRYHEALNASASPPRHRTSPRPPAIPPAGGPRYTRDDDTFALSDPPPYEFDQLPLLKSSVFGYFIRGHQMTYIKPIIHALTLAATISASGVLYAVEHATNMPPTLEALGESHAAATPEDANRNGSSASATHQPATNSTEPSPSQSKGDNANEVIRTYGSYADFLSKLYSIAAAILVFGGVRGTRAASRCKNSRGDMTRWVVPSR